MSRSFLDQRRSPVVSQQPRSFKFFRPNVVRIGDGLSDDAATGSSQQDDDSIDFDQFTKLGKPNPPPEYSPESPPLSDFNPRKRLEASNTTLKPYRGPPRKRLRRLEVARRELKATRAKIAKIESDVAAQGLAGASRAQESELEDLNAAAARQREEIQNLRQALEERDAEVESLKSTRANLQTQVEDLTPVIEQLRKEKTELEARQAQEETLKQQNEIKLQTQETNLNTAAETAKTLRLALEEKERQLQLFKLNAPTSVDSVTPSVIDDVDRQIEVGSRTRDEMLERIRSLENQIKQGTASNRTLESTARRLNDQYMASKEANATLLNKLAAKSTQFQKAVTEYNAQISSTKKRLEIAEAELATAKKNTLASDDAFKDGQEKLQASQANVAKLNSLNDNARQELEQLKASRAMGASSSTMSQQDLNDQIKALESNVRERDRSLEKALAEVDKLTETQENLSQQLFSNAVFTGMQEVANNLRQDLKKMQADYSTTKQQQRLTDAELARHKRALEAANAELDTANIKLEERQSVIETLRKTNEAFVQSERNLREELAGLRSYQTDLTKLANDKTAAALEVAQKAYAALQTKFIEEQKQSKQLLNALNDDAEALRKARDLAAKQAAEYSSTLEQTKAETERLAGDLQGKESDFNTMQHQLSKLVSERADVLERLDTLEQSRLSDDDAGDDGVSVLDFSKRKPTPWQSGINQDQFGVISPTTTWKRNPVSSSAVKRVELVDVNNYAPKISEQASAWRRKMRDVKIAMKIGDPHQVFRDVRALLEQYHHGQLVFYGNFYTMVGFVEGFCGVPNGTFWDATTRGLDHLVKSVIEAASVELTVFPISEAAVFPLSKDDLTAAIAEELRIYRKPPSDSDTVYTVAPPVNVLQTPKDYKRRVYRSAVEAANEAEQSSYTTNFGPNTEEGRFARLNIERYDKKYPAAPLVGLTQRLLESKVDERLDTKLRLFDSSDALLHNYNFLPFLQEKIIKPLNKDQDVYVVEFTTASSELGGHAWTTVFAGHNLNDIAQYLTDHLWQNLQIRQVKGEWVRKPTELSVRNLINTTATNRVLDQIRDIERAPSVPWQVKIQGFLQAAVNATVFSAFMLALTKVGVAFNPESPRVNDLLRDVRFADVVGAIYQSRKKSNTPGTSAISIKQSHQTVSDLIDVLKQAAGIPLNDTPVLSTGASTSTFSTSTSTLVPGLDRAPPPSDEFNSSGYFF